MNHVNILSFLCLCVLINLLFPGCAKDEQPKQEVQPLKLENAQAYNNRGLAYFEKGQYDLAISDYSEAIAIDPKNAAAYYNRGDTWHNSSTSASWFISTSLITRPWARRRCPMP